jgi:hypothetical protein
MPRQPYMKEGSSKKRKEKTFIKETEPMISLPSPITNEPSRFTNKSCQMSGSPRTSSHVAAGTRASPSIRAAFSSRSLQPGGGGTTTSGARLATPLQAAAGPGGRARKNHMMTRPRTLFCCLWFVQLRLRCCTKENVSQNKESFHDKLNIRLAKEGLVRTEIDQQCSTAIMRVRIRELVMQTTHHHFTSI